MFDELDKVFTSIGVFLKAVFNLIGGLLIAMFLLWFLTTGWMWIIAILAIF